MLNLAYDRSIYAHHIYDGRPEPPLRPKDAEWAKQFVPAMTEPALTPPPPSGGTA